MMKALELVWIYMLSGLCLVLEEMGRCWCESGRKWLHSLCSHNHKYTHKHHCTHFYIHVGPLPHVVWDHELSLCHMLELAEITLACRRLG